MDGASTYLALTFGTLLSSQGTDASFVLTLSGFPPGFPFGLAFPTLSDPFFGPTPSQRGLSSRPLGRSDVSNLSASLRVPQIGGRNSNSGMPKSFPWGGRTEVVSAAVAAGGAAGDPIRPCGNPKNFTDQGAGCQPPLAKIFSVQVGEASTGVRLGVLHPAQQAGEHLTERRPLVLVEVLEEVALEDGGHAHDLLPLLPAGGGELHDHANPVGLVPLPGDQALGDHAIDPVGHGGRGQTEALLARSPG